MARTQRVVSLAPYSRPAPITIRVPRAPAAPRKHKRRRSGGGGGARGGSKRVFGAAIGGAIVGFVEKSEVLKDLPDMPLIGKKGTVALVAYFWAKNSRSQLAWDVAFAGAALAGYQFGKEGKVSGDEDFD